MTDVTLSPCQARALTALEGEDNIFLTGLAGTGKSFLVRHFLRGKDPKEVPILASTGAAAILLGGRTFHSFFGLGILEGGVLATVENARRNSKVKKRIKDAKIILIDEISMLPADALDAAEQIARIARGSNAAWGGLRVVVVGDFAQLPPVNPGGVRKPWVFLDDIWERSHFRPVILKTIQRQQDAFFLRILNAIRAGEWIDEIGDFLEERTAAFSLEDSGTRLFPRRDQTEMYNRMRLEELSGELEVYPTEYSGQARYVEALKKQAPVGEEIRLKEGALVMLRVNDPRGRFVNGSLARYRGMDREKRLILDLLSGFETRVDKMVFVYSDGDGEAVASAKNYPINLAWGTTIHKAQGGTFDRLAVDLRNLWEPGHAYVALSRVRSPEGLTVESWNRRSFRASPEVLAFHRAIGM